MFILSTSILETDTDTSDLIYTENQPHNSYMTRRLQKTLQKIASVLRNLQIYFTGK